MNLRDSNAEVCCQRHAVTYGISMIDVLTGFPDGVIAFAARGKVTRSDYADVLVPKVEEAFARHKKIRCYYELGPLFSGMDPGAAWEDFKVGLEHVSGWEKVAIVTDVDWILRAVNILRFMVPGEIRVFGSNQASEARTWITTD